MIYFASALDTEEQRAKNEVIADFVCAHFKESVFLPQTDTGMSGDWGLVDEEICNADLNAIDNSSKLVVNLDACDTGCAIEIGYAYAKGIPCVGFTRDPDIKRWNNMLFVIKNIVVLPE